MFFTKYIFAQRSEFSDEPEMIMPLYLPSSTGRLFSRISPIKLFHIVHALKMKLYFEISRLTLGMRSKKFASLQPWENKLYKETGVKVLSILKVFIYV